VRNPSKFNKNKRGKERRKMKVLIPQDITECGKDYLRQKGYDVVVGSGFDAETIKREGADADAIIMRTAIYSSDVIRSCKKCKIYARYGVGYDNVDVPAATEMGAYVTLATNANQISVAEHTVTMALAVAKRLVALDTKQRENAAENYGLRNSWPTQEIHGKTAAVIGLGRIGLEVASQLHFGFGMKIIGFDAYADPSKLPEYITAVTLEECFRQGDIVTLHVPATPETMNMVNKDIFSIMKPTAILVNCARGGIVNEDDLYDALKAKRIFGAALDVFVDEPPKNDNKLFALDNFIGSPHNAGMTNEARDNMSMSCAYAVDDVLSGRKPQYPINEPKQ